MPVQREPRFQIVLLHPEIPNNTGAIGRTAAATGCRLHIVHPIGFDMGESARRRAGLDYWHLVDCVEHESWDAFVDSEGLGSADSRAWLYSTKAARPHWQASFAVGDYLLFGCETTGPPEAVRRWAGDRPQRHPADDRRSGRAQPQPRERRVRRRLRGPAPARDGLDGSDYIIGP